MQNESQQQGHVRYPCTNAKKCSAIFVNWRKRRKPCGKNPSPKRDRRKPSEGLKKLPTRGMSQKIGIKSDHEEHH